MALPAPTTPPPNPLSTPLPLPQATTVLVLVPVVGVVVMVVVVPPPVVVSHRGTYRTPATTPTAAQGLGQGLIWMTSREAVSGVLLATGASNKVVLLAREACASRVSNVGYILATGAGKPYCHSRFKCLTTKCIICNRAANKKSTLVLILIGGSQ